MKLLPTESAQDVSGGLDPREYETQIAPEPATSDPLVVIDYNPPQQPQ